MTGRREPLDPSERALAAALPRLHGRTEPDPALDAQVLAMAHAAAAAPTPPLRRRSWVVPLSVAASITLAVGLAWRLRPLPPLPASGAVPVVVAPPERMAVERAQPAPPPPPIAARPGAGTPADAEPVRGTFATPVPPAAPSPAPQAAAPAPGTGAPATDSAEGAQAAAPAPSPPAAPATSAAPVPTGEREVLVTGASRNRARSEAEAPPAEAFAVDPDEDVPPATADSPEVREAWLRRIGELVRQGRSEEARESLAEFRRRYPGAPLPPELQALEP